MRYIVINIGCIECGVTSEVVGVFTDKERADRLAAYLGNKAGWREGGQNSYEVFEEPEPDTIHPDYAEYLGDFV